MSNALGRALMGLGQGFGQQAEAQRRQQELQQAQDAALAEHGIFRSGVVPPQQPSPLGRALIGDPVSDPILSAVRHVGITDVAPGFGDGEVRVDPIQAPAPPRDPMAAANALRTLSIGGRQYEQHPELTPEGQRLARTTAANRLAYDQYSRRHPKQKVEYNDGVNYGQVLEGDLGRETRTALDPGENRAAYDAIPATAFGGHKPQYVEGVDYRPTYQSYLRGELGQQNRVDFRVQFPPQAGGGRNGDGLTPTQQRAATQRDAEDRMRLRVREVGPAGIVPEDYHRISRSTGGQVSQAHLIEIATDEARKIAAGNHATSPSPFAAH